MTAFNHIKNVDSLINLKDILDDKCQSLIRWLKIEAAQKDKMKKKSNPHHILLLSCYYINDICYIHAFAKQVHTMPIKPITAR